MSYIYIYVQPSLALVYYVIELKFLYCLVKYIIIVHQILAARFIFKEFRK